MHEISIFVIVDAEGNYAVGADIDQANDGCDDLEASPRRVLRLAMNVELPTLVELTANVPAEKVGPLTLTVK